MTRRLTAWVHLTIDGALVSYGPDDEVPADHAALITNPKAWADEPAPDAEPEPGDEPAPDAAPKTRRRR